MHGLSPKRRQEVEIGCPIEILRNRLRVDGETAAETGSAVADVARPVIVRWDGNRHRAIAVGQDVRSVASIIVKRRVRAESGENINRSRAIRVVVEADQQIRRTKSLVGENIKILPSLKRRAGGESFMNPDQVIDQGLEPVTIRVGTVVTNSKQWDSLRR